MVQGRSGWRVTWHAVCFPLRGIFVSAQYSARCAETWVLFNQFGSDCFLVSIGRILNSVFCITNPLSRDGQDI